MPIDKIDTLYANLEAISREKGIPIVDKETFIKNMQIPEKVKKLRSDLSNMGYSVADEEVFINNMKLEEPVATPTEPLTDKLREQKTPLTEKQNLLNQKMETVTKSIITPEEVQTAVTKTKEIKTKPLTQDEKDVALMVQEKTPFLYEKYKKELMSTLGSVKQNAQGYSEILSQLMTGYQNIHRNIKEDITGKGMTLEQKNDLSERIASWNARAQAFGDLYKEGNLGEKISGALSQFAPAAIQLIAMRRLGNYGMTFGATTAALQTASRDVDIDTADALNIAANAGVGYLQQKFVGIKPTDTLLKTGGKFVLDTAIDQTANVALNQIYNLKDVSKEEKRKAFDGWLQTFVFNSLANGISYAQMSGALKNSKAIKKFAERENISLEEVNQELNSVLNRSQQEAYTKNMADKKISKMKAEDEQQAEIEMQKTIDAYKNETNDSDIEMTVMKNISEEANKEKTEQNAMRILAKTLKDVKDNKIPTAPMKSFDDIINGNIKNIDEFETRLNQDLNEFSKNLIDEGVLDSEIYETVGKKYVTDTLKEMKLKAKMGEVPVDEINTMIKYVEALDGIRRNKNLAFVDTPYGETVAVDTKKLATEIYDKQVETDTELGDTMKNFVNKMSLKISASVERLPSFLKRINNPILNKLIITDGLNKMEQKLDNERMLIEEVLPKNKMVSDMFNKKHIDEYHDVGLKKRLSDEEVLSLYMTYRSLEAEGGIKSTYSFQKKLMKNIELSGEEGTKVLNKVKEIVESNPEMMKAVDTLDELFTAGGNMQKQQYLRDTGGNFAPLKNYFPVYSDTSGKPIKVSEAMKLEEGGIPEVTKQSTGILYENIFRQRQRTKNDEPIIIKPLGAVLRDYITNTPKYASMKGYTDTVNKTLNSVIEVNGKKIRLDKWITENYGNDVVKKIRTAVRDVVGNAPDRSMILSLLRGNLSRNTFYMNFISSAKSRFSSESYLAKQTPEIRDRAKQIMSELGVNKLIDIGLKNSILWDRYHNLNYNLAVNTMKNALEALDYVDNPAFKKYKNFSENELEIGAKPMEISDKHAMADIVASELAKLDAQGLGINNPEIQKQAAKEAAMQVIETQPSINPLTSSPLTTSEFGKIIFMYQSQNMQNISTMTESVTNRKINEKELYKQAEKTILYENLVKSNPELRTSQQGYERELQRLEVLKDRYWESVRQERNTVANIMVVQPAIMGMITALVNYYIKEKRTKKNMTIDQKKAEFLIRYGLKESMTPETRAVLAKYYGTSYRTFEEELLSSITKEGFNFAPVIGEFAYGAVQKNLPTEKNVTTYEQPIDFPMLTLVNNMLKITTDWVDEGLKKEMSDMNKEFDDIKFGLSENQSSTKVVANYFNKLQNKKDEQDIQNLNKLTNKINTWSIVPGITGIGVPISPITTEIRTESNLKKRDMEFRNEMMKMFNILVK